MKSTKNLKLIAAALIGIIIIMIGINVLLIINSKNDKTTKLIANSSSEMPLINENKEQEIHLQEPYTKNNADELKPNDYTLPTTSKVLTHTVHPTSSATQIKTSESEPAVIESSAINEQNFSELQNNIIKPAIDSFNGEIDIYFEILNHDLIFATRKEPMYPASLAKLFLMGTIFQAIEDGIIEYNDNIAYDLRIMITVSDNAAFNRLFI